MFNTIITEIQNIFPIVAIREENNKLYVEYDGQPSKAQLEEIKILLLSWPVKKLQYFKIKEIENNWKSKVKQGLPTSYGWYLGVDIQDVALLNGAFTLAKEASSLGLTTPVSIIDTDGISHELNLNELTQLMLAYGQARSQLSNIYATKLNQIKNASSVEELESLYLTI